MTAPSLRREPPRAPSVEQSPMSDERDRPRGRAARFAAESMAEVFHRVREPSAEGGEGDGTAAATLLSEIYREIHRIARSRFRKPSQTLRTTDLVQEVFLKFLQNGTVEYRSREHFLALAARAMRQLLVDHLRSRGRLKRGADRERVALDDICLSFEERSVDLLVLDEALREFEGQDPQAARVVELRFFGDYTTKETAEILGVSTRTVERDWAGARAWLGSRLR